MSTELPAGVLAIDPERHLVRTTELSNFLASRLKRPFFTYFHAQRQVWVVAIWLDKAKRWCRELLVLDNLGDFTAEDRRALEKWCNWRTPTPRETIRDAERNERHELLKWQEDNEEELRLKRHIGKMLGGVEQYNPFWRQPGLYVHND